MCTQVIFYDPVYSSFIMSAITSKFDHVAFDHHLSSLTLAVLLNANGIDIQQNNSIISKENNEIQF